MAAPDLWSVDTYQTIIEPYLEQLYSTRRTDGIDPVLADADCSGLIGRLRAQAEDDEKVGGQQARFAAIETVFRNKFYALLVSVEITEPAFTQIWILLDTVGILSDEELCESGLVFWLIEELLDSQTIDGCRKVFDYLESRRERITSKHFKQKQLIILRCCNELLRRLSRAEDIVFCGRVFIFLFQSFPLGDKSSVNLRGEFHVENVTTFDETSTKSEDAIKPMDLDVPETGNQDASNAGTPATSAVDSTESQRSPGPSAKTSGALDDESQPDLDALYPLFWGLQSYFSAPTRLFEAASLQSFKEGIDATMACFQKLSAHTSAPTRPDESRRGIKRKRSESGSEISTTFNPKYLTNRDLFDLEVHDIAFRRHVLVQMLILLDFLLSLTPASKAKLAELTNKSVLYNYTLGAGDAEWANNTRASIASYLQLGSGNEGKFYYRMVNTVLSRDKNWVRWKAENCPPIDRPAVPVEQHIEAQRNLERLCGRKALPTPTGSSDLEFLSRNQPMESLQDPARYSVPSLESLYEGIQRDELDAEVGTPEDIQAATDAKQRKIWKALRASKNRFTLCEKIENGKNLKALVGAEEGLENIAPVESAAEGAGDGPGEAPPNKTAVQ